LEKTKQNTTNKPKTNQITTKKVTHTPPKTKQNTTNNNFLTSFFLNIKKRKMNKKRRHQKNLNRKF